MMSAEEMVNANDEFRQLLVGRALDSKSRGEYYRGMGDAYEDILNEFQKREFIPPVTINKGREGSDAGDAAGESASDGE